MLPVSVSPHCVAHSSKYFFSNFLDSSEYRSYLAEPPLCLVKPVTFRNLRLTPSVCHIFACFLTILRAQNLGMAVVRQ